MGRGEEINRRLIRRKWRELRFADTIGPFFNEEISLNRRKMVCLKDSYKSSVWKLEIRTEQSSFPIILKISKPLRKPRPESKVERNVYRKAKPVLQPFMPQIYMTKRNVNGRDLWVFMEFIEPIEGRVQYTPEHFEKIIPTLAKLHAATMGKPFKPYEKLFESWMPRYDTPEMKQERIRINKETIYYLDEAMKVPSLHSLLKPHYVRLRKLLMRGPEYFPEVTKAGMSIVHGDLHTANMASHDVKAKDWQLKFIDWEGAKIAPCWFDLVNLIGIFLAYRREWKADEKRITRRSVRLYADEMRKHGVVFNMDPMNLYRRAYLKRILERSLYLQLNWAVTGKKEAKLLPVFLEKLQVWGPKIGLY